MKALPILVLLPALFGIFFIPDTWFFVIVTEQGMKESLTSNLLTVVTFLCGFVLLILPMKVDTHFQSTPKRQRLHKCLVERNRFLMVLFLLFLIAIVMLLMASCIKSILFFKILFFILFLVLISIIRLFFIIKEYVEYSD